MLVVEGEDLVDHEAVVEGLLAALSAGVAQALAEVGLVDELAQGVGEGVDVAWGDQEAGFVVVDDFAGAVDVEGDDGFAGEESLGEGAGEAFA